MYLFEAIKLGALLKPQGFGAGSGEWDAKATCAFGAAREATGFIDKAIVTTEQKVEERLGNALVVDILTSMESL